MEYQVTLGFGECLVSTISFVRIGKVKDWSKWQKSQHAFTSVYILNGIMSKLFGQSF